MKYPTVALLVIARHKSSAQHTTKASYSFEKLKQGIKGVNHVKQKLMTENKKTVQQYMDGFIASDHAKILECLADDIVWIMPGFINLTGKEAFDKEIENDYFIGSPTIKITRMVEEDNIVVAEGSVKCKKKDGGMLDAVFCDVFHMENGKIKQLTTYQMDK